jgi:hypothetical protein
MGKPGAVDNAITGTWAGTTIGLEGMPEPDGNHAKVGVSTGTHSYAIFGDLNQQGALSGKCGSSQNGRGGLFYWLRIPSWRSQFANCSRASPPPPNKVPEPFET